MWWILFSEGCRYAWTRNYSAFVRGVSARLMRKNLVYTKVFQAIVAKYAPCEMAHNIPYPPDEVAPALSAGLEAGGVIGSGMVAVVFAGTANGRPVAIKVKRKDIAAKLAAGLRDVKRTLGALAWLPWLRRFSLLEVLAEVREMLLAQIDFEQEARNQTRFRAMYAFNKRIVVPKLHPEFCTSEQLVMDLLQGGPPQDCPDAAALFSQVIVKSAVIDGFIHADMHVGNVFFMKEGLGIIDFGLMLELTKEQQDAYIILSKFLLANCYDEAAIYTLNTYFTRAPQMPPNLVPKISAIFRAVKQRNVFGVNEVAEMAAAAYPYKVAPFFYKIVLSMGAADALLQKLSSTSLDLLLQNVATFSD
jgi:predicted unusual protein kinase regulating ubiquinone biosynthesis (AarF/ABC1/UbiB family)